jgi:hypothetical protein
MKKLFAATLFVLAFALTTAAQNACTRVTEVAGGFFYCTPAGWAPQEERGQDFKVVYGPESTALTPNINFQINTGNIVTLSDFTDAVVKNMLAATAGMGRNQYRGNKPCGIYHGLERKGHQGIIPVAIQWTMGIHGAISIRYR